MLSKSPASAIGKARRAARGHKERVNAAATKLLRLLKQPGRVVDRGNKPIKLTKRMIAIRYKQNGRAKFGIPDHALLKVLGT